ncbi:MAG: nitrogen fixation protein NifH [Sphaerochaetaceae bacterium]|nr:nitrogen fixation protein NifH [Sphaerochaetaceae bacterium]
MDTAILDWLLEKDDPSVRYETLTTLLGLHEDDPLVLETRSEIMKNGVVRHILDLQEPGGYWGVPHTFYTAKYSGTVWNVLILAEMGAHKDDLKVRYGCEFLLSHSMEPESGGFSTGESRKTNRGLSSLVIPCLTGNMVYALSKLGYGQDERLKKSIEWICTYQQSDDGESVPPQGEMYDRYRYCWGSHSCHMGVAKALKGLAAIPTHMRNELVNHKIEQLVEYFLKHRIFKKSHDLNKISKPGWTKFGFPLMYQSDVLEILDILASLHIHSPDLDEAISLVEKKRTPDGTWKMENSFNDRLLVPIETKGLPSKWVTLKALRVLKTYR